MFKQLRVLSVLLLTTSISLAQTVELAGEITSNVAAGGTGDPTNYIKTDLISPSPNAASIGRYGEVPVNLSTGTASLSIPVFTVSGNELSLPITLNYSYDGFKPAQPVSWIGIGWSLNAGGVITRTIKDRVDNTAASNYNYDSQYVQDSINTFNGPSVAFLHSIAQGNIDSEPDIYSFNFGNYSGKFLIFQGQYYCFPAQKFKITGATPAGFQITTDDGVQYFFTETETTSPKGSYGVYNIPSYTSSWYLTKITNATNTESIYLNYATEATITQSGSLTQSVKVYTSSTNNGPLPQSQLFDPALGYPTYVTPKRLVSIVSEKHKVTFSGVGREDLEGNQALNHIVIENNTGAVIKNFVLKQSYSGSLKLDTLIEHGRIDDDSPNGYNPDALKHAFEYNGSSFGRSSAAWVDHYGFYTGKGAFSTVLMPNTIYASGVDRSPVLSGTLLGAMTKVTYPTGGYTTFEYELNKRAGQKTYTGQTTTKSLVINRPVNNPTNTISTSGYLTIANPQTISITITRTAKAPYGDNIARNSYMDFKLTGNGINETGMISFESENAGKTFTYTLNPGFYTLFIYCDEKEKMISAYYTYKLNNNVPVEGEDVGGLRIKKLTSYPATGPILTKEYSYTYPDGFSSGITNQSAYSEKTFEERFPTGNGAMDYYVNISRISNSTIAESYYMGVPHYYKSVAEAISSAGEKFITRTDFKSFDFSLGVEPVRVTKYKNGVNNELIPIERMQYDYQTGTVGAAFNAIRPEKIMEAQAGPLPLYNYSISRYSHAPAWKYINSQRNVRYEGTDSLETITTNGYDVNGTKNLLWTKTTDSRGKEQITRYKYPESYTSTLNSANITKNVLTPVWEQQSWSKSGTDSVLVAGAITEYNNTSFKPVKIRSLTTPGISVLNGETKTGGLYNTLVSDNRYEERVQYTYDSFGKIVRQQLTGGVPVSYKWSYTATPYMIPSTNKTYVTAECKNAIETEFYTEDFEEDASATIGTAHTGYRFKNGSYTVSWTRPNSRNYLISYWYLSGGKWLLKAPQAYTTNSVALSGGTAYDDIRIYPSDAQLNTYTILPGIGMASMIDGKGLTTYYEYDEHERLKNIKGQDGNILKNVDYNYAGALLVGYGAGPYSSVAISGSFTKNNCDTYDVGSTVIYTVIAGKYKGATQAEADAYAQADVNANGQTYANTNGTCTTGGPIE